MCSPRERSTGSGLISDWLIFFEDPFSVVCMCVCVCVGVCVGVFYFLLSQFILFYVGKQV